MLLGRGVILAFNDHIGLRKGCGNIAFADFVMQDRVAVPVGVQQDFIAHRFFGVGDRWQIPVFDFDQAAGLGGNRFAFGHHGGNLVADKAHSLGVGLIGTEAA